MKVHRIITTIEVENDNSITSIELTKLYPANADIPLAITNLTTNGNGDDIKQVYAVVDDCRGLINDKLKSIAYSLNNCFDINKVYAVVDKLRVNISGERKSIARDINTVLTQSGVRGESPIEPDGTSKTS